MPERIEDRLHALRDEVAWPSTPDIARAVAARLEAGAPEDAASRRSAQPPARRPLARRPRRLAVAVALALLVPAAGALAVPSVRDDVLDWLGLQGAEVRRAPALPSARPPGDGDLGRPVSLDEAARLAGFRPALPAALGPPEEVRFDESSGFVTLVYDGLVVAQARGALTHELVRKIVTTRTEVRAVRVGGAPGVFLDGAPHAYLYVAPDGTVQEDRARLAGSTLVFNRGDTLVRIEGKGLELGRALRIARSLRS
ncbi:MAG TPA: hypothetical protein VGW75_10070 [Solirubrobacteraceae bacterium]|jgi:hypothetical protein|nr:hypothetical protein [Solirubrobacteraceae bacterium]